MAPIPKKSLRQFVLITGMSGSGKGSVLKAFEDLGFYCVDNLPVDLIPKFMELASQAGSRIERAAMVQCKLPRPLPDTLLRYGSGRAQRRDGIR